MLKVMKKEGAISKEEQLKQERILAKCAVTNEK